MASEKLQTINRAVLIVKAKEPLRQWLHNLPDGIDMTLDEINRDCTTYLVPEYGTQDELSRIIKDSFKKIFELELESWWLKTSDWPDTSDYDLFRKWFDVEVHSLVLDLAPGHVKLEDF